MKDFVVTQCRGIRIWVLGCALLWAAVAGHGTTYFYVDPDWSGTATGAPSSPWTNLLSSGWTVINAALASDDVTVYFSARTALFDTDQMWNRQTTIGINLNRRDTSSHRLTLDGMSVYNTDDTAPAWSNYNGVSRFTISRSSGSISGIIGPVNSVQSYITVRGFKIVARSGKIVSFWGGDHVVIEYIEGSHAPDSSDGPGIYWHYAWFPGKNGRASDDITIQHNTIRDTYGEGIYIGGVHDGNTTLAGHSNITIQYNTIVNAGRRGGEGDCLEVKPANSNVVIRGNTIYRTEQTANGDGIGINGAAVVEGNYIANVGRSGIRLKEYWDSNTGYRNGGTIRNNIIVNCGQSSLASTQRNGITIERQAGGDDWKNVRIFNNTIYLSDQVGIRLEGDAGSNFIVNNNIVYKSGGLEVYVVNGGALADHNYNNYYDDSGSVARYGAVVYDSASISLFEANSLSVNPEFVDTNSPYYSPSYFALRPTSMLIDAGTTLSGFSDDFFGTIRPLGAAWDMGASEEGVSSSSRVNIIPAPAAPTKLRVR